MLDAIALGELTPKEARIYLEAVIRTELAKIERLRHVSRFDPVNDNIAQDRRLDWAAMQAWRLFAERGIKMAIDKKEVEAFEADGATYDDLDTLNYMLELLGKTTLSEAGVAKMIAHAREVIPERSDGTTGLPPTPSANTVLQLRHLLVAGKAEAWKAASSMKDPHQEWAGEFAQKLLAGPRLPEEFLATGVENLASPQHSPHQVDEVQKDVPNCQASTLHMEKFTFNPNLLALAQRVNGEKDRQDIKEDTRRQLIAGVKLFTKATGVERVTDISQQHLKYFKGILQRLPRSYGKRPADAELPIEEILERADHLIEEKVGLAPRTINGHLSRLALLLQFAKSEGLKVSPEIQIDLLRVRETARARDKRPGFTTSQVCYLFRHTIWCGCRNHKRRHLEGNVILKDGLYWGPLLSAYSGARREELLALAPDDFRTVDGVPCYYIRDNEHRGLKTLGSERLVPVHSHLIELGLLQHVEEMRKHGKRAIFPELIPENSSENFGDKIFYNWDKALEIQFDGNQSGLCFHSFRHYVISFLKSDPTVTEKQRRDLVGHIGKDSHDENYEIPTSMPEMLKVVERLPRVF